MRTQDKETEGTVTVRFSTLCHFNTTYSTACGRLQLLLVGRGPSLLTQPLANLESSVSAVTQLYMYVHTKKRIYSLESATLDLTETRAKKRSTRCDRTG